MGSDWFRKPNPAAVELKRHLESQLHCYRTRAEQAGSTAHQIFPGLQSTEKESAGVPTAGEFRFHFDTAMLLGTEIIIALITY
ncbi:hypothetical protein M422DRAFT_269721 [Sphaerobolus stellatus SS14]|uniref:Uncharacterized protein n=1 Tax=Sphaerobolus stellatus (strain SS14) TaxID=990650 RepID=A0A0C9UUF1_SPHS4|nr:hypothetical protein M422DRAFT_269721 [Sphaerobolus stellatus SS14]